MLCYKLYSINQMQSLLDALVECCVWYQIAIINKSMITSTEFYSNALSFFLEHNGYFFYPPPFSTRTMSYQEYRHILIRRIEFRSTIYWSLDTMVNMTKIRKIVERFIVTDMLYYAIVVLLASVVKYNG